MTRVPWAALTVYAAAFAFVEAACVVSLKQLYFPEGWRPPFHPIPDAALRLEQWREIATLVMIAGVALLGRPPARLAIARALWVFGIWDLGYYAFLRALTGFPASLADLDIVFLVPRAWVAPVWLPVVSSVACLAAAVWLARSRRPRRPWS